VVADERGLADRPVLAQHTRAVGEHGHAAAQRGGGAHAVHDGRDAVALVEVGATREHEHARAADAQRHRLAAVAEGGGLPEARHVGERASRALAEHADRVGPAGAQDGDHVVVPAEARAQIARRIRREVERRRHAAMLGARAVTLSMTTTGR